MAAPLPQMLTANRLRDGEVVWWKAGSWVIALSDAEVLADPKAAGTALEAAQAFVRDNVVVNPYLFEVRIEGDAIVVSSPDVKAPVAVRYAWASSPDCKLFNREGLPASPFRTDDWPGQSPGKK